MKQETNDKMKAILAEAQAKANAKATPKFLATPAKAKEEKPAEIPQPEPVKAKIRISPEQLQAAQPEPTPQATASQTPELSLFTFDDLLKDTAPQFCAPMPLTMPVFKPQPKEETPALKIVDYSDRSFAIVTATKPSEEILNILRQHGSYNANLKCGKGWIFSKRHLQTLKQKLGLKG